MNFEGQPLKALVDTGATVSLLSERFLAGRKDIKILPYTKAVRDASNRLIPIKGKLLINIQVPEGVFKEYVLIPEQDSVKTDLLLGMNVIAKATLDLPRGKIQFDPVKGYKSKINSRPFLKMLDEEIYSPVEVRNDKKVTEVTDMDVPLKLVENTITNVHLLKPVKVPANTCVRRELQVTGLSDGEDIFIHRTQIQKGSILVPETVTKVNEGHILIEICLLYTSPSPRDKRQSRMPSSA